MSNFQHNPDSQFLCGQSEKKFYTCCGFLVLVSLVFVLTILGLLHIRKNNADESSFKMPKSLAWVAGVVVFWELIRIVYLMQIFYWQTASDCTASLVQDLPFVFMFLTVVIAHDFMIDLYCKLTDRFSVHYQRLRKMYTFSTVMLLVGLFLVQNANVCEATT